jgi:hypothetical protein
VGSSPTLATNFRSWQSEFIEFLADIQSPDIAIVWAMTIYLGAYSVLTLRIGEDRVSN